MKHLRKNNGKVETFNSKKLASSIEKALLSNHYSQAQARQIAQEVTKNVVEWLSQKTEVTHLDIRYQAAKNLNKYDKNAALLYKKHKDLW